MSSKQQVNIRMDPELRSWAIAAAAQEDKTFGDFVEEAVEDAVLRKQESTLRQLGDKAQQLIDKKKKKERAAP